MQVILFDTHLRKALFPFTHLRPQGDLRIGILTFREKWSRLLNTPVACYTAPYLQRDSLIGEGEQLFINGGLYPSEEIVVAIRRLAAGETLLKDNTILASRHPSMPEFLEGERKYLEMSPASEEGIQPYSATRFGRRRQAGADASDTHTSASPEVAHNHVFVQYQAPVFQLEAPWQLFQKNAQAVAEDFALLTSGRKSAPVSATNRCIAPEHIFLEEGVQMEYCLLNASDGPIYLGAGALVMEGASLRGPVSIGEKTVVKMGARIYGATTAGPHCTIGGEIKNTVFFGYSNKAHDGYLGDAVIGEWCNLGAGTSASNIKNSAGTISVWSEAQGSYIPAAAKCGLLMGDYSKSAINTSFNTGTVVGIGSSVFTVGSSPAFIPHFSWGGKLAYSYHFEKAVADFARWKELKNQQLADWEVRQLKHIFDAGTHNFIT